LWISWIETAASLPTRFTTHWVDSRSAGTIVGPHFTLKEFGGGTKLPPLPLEPPVPTVPPAALPPEPSRVASAPPHATATVSKAIGKTRVITMLQSSAQTDSAPPPKTYTYAKLTSTYCSKQLRTENENLRTDK
jgi:hypothetical protein